MEQPELTILLLCLSDGHEAEKVDRLAKVSPEEWQAVAALAKQLDVASIMRHQLKQLGIALPDSAADLLKRVFLRQTARNIRLYKELGILLRRLHQEDIPVIVLKGAYLAEIVYDNIGLRTMGDIDLLIPAGDVEKSIGLLETMGFNPDRPFWPETDINLHYHAPSMVKDGLHVELHWNLTRESNLPGISPDGLWARAQRIALQGSEAWALCSSDLILHLAVHAAYGHQFSAQFRSLLDIATVLHKFGDDIDWASMAQTCQAWQAERGTYLTLRLVVELFGSEVPEEVLEVIKPSNWSEKTLEWAKVRLFQTNPVLSEQYIRLMHSKNLVEKFAALLNGLFPSRGVMAMLYGVPPDSWRILTFYPRHAATRIRKYWRHAWHLMLGDRDQAIESESDQSLRDWLRIK